VHSEVLVPLVVAMPMEVVLDIEMLTLLPNCVQEVPLVEKNARKVLPVRVILTQ
jgi:hypothetical protein